MGFRHLVAAAVAVGFALADSYKGENGANNYTTPTTREGDITIRKYTVEQHTSLRHLLNLLNGTRLRHCRQGYERVPGMITPPSSRASSPYNGRRQIYDLRYRLLHRDAVR